MVQTNPGTIFTGPFGSGKTEIALNYAVAMAEATREGPILVDLDLVTPYFRSREAVRTMNTRGVEVIAPLALSQAIDVPAVVPEILGAIQQPARPIVLDVGGDEQGARALGQYCGALQQRGYRMNFVVNPFRPQSATPEAIRLSVAGVERTSRLRVSALVSNPNLMAETDPQTVKLGHSIVTEAARTMGLPVAFLALTGPIAAMMQSEVPLAERVLLLYRYFLAPWEIAAVG